MANKCPDCGEELPRIWTDHACQKALVQPVAPRKEDQRKKSEPSKTDGKSKDDGKDRALHRGSYKYRDPEKRKAYMREYMRKWRGKKDA